MLRKLLLTAAVALITVAASSVARADTVNFVGGFGATATVTNYTLSGNTFTFTVTNTFAIFSRTDPDFNIAQDVNVQAGAVTSAGVNAGVFDFALLTGNNFGGGKVAEGLAPGQSATFVITGDFSGMTAEQIARSLSLRFQGIGPRDESTVAEPGPGSEPIPEPMTMILMGTGLAGVAAKVRRRRKNAAA